MGRVRYVRLKRKGAHLLARRRVGRELGGGVSECCVVWVRWFLCVRRSRLAVRGALSG